MTVLIAAITRLAHLPTLNETLQDKFTRHFQPGRPDVPDPWSRLMTLQRNVLVPYVQELAWSGLFVAALGLAVVVLLRWRADAGLIIVAMGATGAGVVLLHPVRSEIPRLALPLWIPVVLGLALAAHAALTSRTSRADLEEPALAG